MTSGCCTDDALRDYVARGYVPREIGEELLARRADALDGTPAPLTQAARDADGAAPCMKDGCEGHMFIAVTRCDTCGATNPAAPREGKPHDGVNPPEEEDDGPPPTPGTEEGQACNRDGCEGVIAWRPPDNCSCHINPPCSQCVAARLYCPECDWSSE